MARRDRRRAARKGKRGKSWKDSGLVWLGGGVLLLALAIIPAMNFSPADHHPEPRADAHERHVVAGAQYASYPRVAEIYNRVAEVPQVIDGIYCYCACSEHSGHYSLLDCYKDAHAARCDVCLSEADMAYEMHKDGKSLDAIRTAIDRLYET